MQAINLREIASNYGDMLDLKMEIIKMSHQDNHRYTRLRRSTRFSKIAPSSSLILLIL
jgi:hypothetical protein